MLNLPGQNLTRDQRQSRTGQNRSCYLAWGNTADIPLCSATFHMWSRGLVLCPSLKPTLMTCLASWLFINMSDLSMSMINTAALPFGSDQIRADQWAPNTSHMDHGGTLPQTCSVWHHHLIWSECNENNVLIMIMICLTEHQKSHQSMFPQWPAQETFLFPFSLVESSYCFPSSSFYMWTQ